MARDTYEDGLTPAIVQADKRTATAIRAVLDKAEREVHALAMDMFAVDSDIGLHYLAVYDAARHVTLSVKPGTNAPWHGGPSTGPHASDRHKRRR